MGSGHAARATIDFGALARLARAAMSLVLFALVACANAASPPARTPSGVDTATSGAPTPSMLDPAVRSGVLPNGLTYFVMHRDEPLERAALWLAVNAGSVLEDDDQRGVAHFVEHMAFNG